MRNIRAQPGSSVLALGVAAASLSGVALLLLAFARVSLSVSLMVAAPLSVVTIFALATRTKPQNRAVFLQRLGSGIFAGILGLIAYDAVRWLILISSIVPFNPFRAVEVFGLLILKTDIDTGWTKAVGWAFHVWNGLAFAMMFTLALGRGRLSWAILWSLMLEGAMLATYPSIFRVLLDWPFVAVSLAGHLAYGIALGMAAQGAVRDRG